MEKEKKHLKIRGKGRIGNIRLSGGWNEIIVVMQISKMIEKKEKVVFEKKKVEKRYYKREKKESEILNPANERGV